MTTSITPVFLFSLPRSGSTLCQRILGADSRIATTAEPWLLLPPLYSLRGQGVYTEYNHRLSVEAVEDFCTHLPRGREDYLAEAAEMARRLYAKAAATSRPDARFFLDKTPRYALIADDVCRMFPDGKFVFLWRNPLAVIASIIETWGGGRWNIHTCKVDLFRGLDSLVTAYETHRERSFAIRFVDVVTEPETHLRQLYTYLDMPFDPVILQTFSQTTLTGRMGDKAGQKYRGLTAEPLDKWKTVLASPFRKWWCRRYLQWIGAERMALMGYDLETLQAELRAIPLRPQRAVPDLVRAGYGWAYNRLEFKIVRDKLQRLPSYEGLYAHR